MRWTVNAPSIVKEANQPKSFFLTEFTPQSLKSFSNCITSALELGQQILPIYITSLGGSSWILNGFLSLMDSGRKNGLRFATIVQGCAMSAGFCVFAFGCPNLRFCSPYSELMVHFSQLSGLDGSVSEVKSFLDVVVKQEIPLFERISKHLGKRKDWFQKKLSNNLDWHLTAEEALAEGICDHIHNPVFALNFECSVSIS